MARDEVRRHFRGDNYALSSELGGDIELLTPAPLDAYAESDSASLILSDQEGMIVFPVSASENWGPNTGEAGTVMVVATDGGVYETFAPHNSSALYYRTWSGSAWNSWVDLAATGFYQTIKEGGTARTQRAAINFGNGLDAVDDSGNNETDVSVDESELAHNSLGGLTTGDPHTQYQLESEKDANSGYVGRGASGQVAVPYLDMAEQSGATPSADTGRLYTIDVGGKTEPEYRDSGGVVARPFLDTYFVAQNTTGSTITKGTVVRVSGQSASRIPLISAADADASATMPAAGITMESIANNAYGRVMVQGVLTALATTGLTAGAPVYVSGTAGALTATAPVYPAFRQVLGTVMNVHGSTGEIFVNVSHFFRQVGFPINLTFFYGSTLAVTTGVGRAPITTNAAGTITEVRAAVNTAPTGAAINLSAKKNGSSFATPSIAASANAGSSTGLSTAVAAGDYITVDITQVGSTVAGSDLVVTVEVMTAN